MDTTLTVVSANGASFPDLNDIVVGGASDVIVTVRCVATPVGPVEWSYGGNSSVVASGLTPFGVSQEDGVLRIYPASLLGEEAQYTCNNSAQTHTVSVQFRLGKNKKTYKLAMVYLADARVVCIDKPENNLTNLTQAAIYGSKECLTNCNIITGCCLKAVHTMTNTHMTHVASHPFLPPSLSSIHHSSFLSP